jgi:hypothetical protein
VKKKTMATTVIRSLYSSLVVLLVFVCLVACSSREDHLRAKVGQFYPHLSADEGNAFVQHLIAGEPNNLQRHHKSDDPSLLTRDCTRKCFFFASLW